MRALLSAEVLSNFGFAVAWFSIVAFIAYPLADKSLSRVVLLGVISVTPLMFRTVMRVPFVRLWLHQLRYRFLGPTYQIQAGATFQTTFPGNDKDLLVVGLKTARKVYDKTEVDSFLSNRLIISGSTSRTIRLDVFQAEEDEFEEAGLFDAFDAEEVEQTRTVEASLRGYQAKSSQIVEMVEGEIVPFFDHLSTAMNANIEGRNFWLRITLPSRNPFLQFYLKDVPDADVSKFQLEFTQVMAGDKVRVAIQKDGFGIDSFNPRPLGKTVRTYLSTPALAHSDF